MTTLPGLLLVGVAIGVLGRLVARGDNPMSWWVTILLGIVGALVGGWVAGLLGADLLGKYLFGVAVAAILVVVLGQRRDRRLV